MQHQNPESEYDWFKSSYSSGAENCLESAKVPGLVPVRDSKAKQGPALAFTQDAWGTFIDHVKRGDFGAA